MTKYTLWADLMGDGKEDSFYPKFTFVAKSQRDATDKAAGW